MARDRSKGTSGAPEFDIYVGLTVVAFVSMLTALLLLIFYGLKPYHIL